MSNLEIAKVSSPFQAAVLVATTTNSGTLTITAANNFTLGCSRILGLRYSSDAAGLVPLLVGSTAVPTPFFVKSVTPSAAGSAPTTAVVLGTQTAVVGGVYVWLIWLNETAASSQVTYVA